MLRETLRAMIFILLLPVSIPIAVLIMGYRCGLAIADAIDVIYEDERIFVGASLEISASSVDSMTPKC